MKSAFPTDRNPVQTSLRRARLLRRLGTERVCVFCDVDAPEVLERHHVFGRAIDPTLMVTLCKNCHAKQTEALMIAGATSNGGASLPLLEALVVNQRAEAAFLRQLAASRDAWADRLETMLKSKEPRSHDQ